MKTFTFKIKFKDREFPNTLIAINCPLEVFYESVKQTSELMKDMDKFYITQSDYLDDGKPVFDDVYFGELSALFASKELKDFLLHPDVVHVSEEESADEK